VLDQLREGFRTNLAATVGADETLRLAEAVRVLALAHGPAAGPATAVRGSTQERHWPTR
jgi:hypothetical protein